MQTITVKCKLVISDEERQAIDKTMVAFANACNDAIRVGSKIGSASNVRIHGHCYHDLRAKHGLSANLAVRAIARAAGILKVKDRRHSTCSPTSIDYDARIFSFREEDWRVSLSTVEGRLKGLALSVGDYQKNLLQGQKPTSAVVFKTRQGAYYIGLHIDVETAPPDLDEERAWLGVDLGIVNLATDSDGTTYSGEVVLALRSRYHRTRASLQAKGTRGSRKLLRRLSGREQRLQRNINHTISKRIVDTAKRTGRGIRLEDLSGIRDRVQVRKDQRRRHHSWAFYDLRTKIEYKAALACVPVELVDPRYTSCACPECGHQEKANRKSQREFVCQACGHEADADLVGAMNISLGGAVNRPEVAQARLSAAA